MNKYFILILLSVLSFRTNAQVQSTSSTDTLVVSFISIGAGIDYKAKDRLILFVRDFEREHDVKIDVAINHWGREGETDYNYDLKRLSRKQCKEFVKQIEEIFKKNNLVKISTESLD